MRIKPTSSVGQFGEHLVVCVQFGDNVGKLPQKVDSGNETLVLLGLEEVGQLVHKVDDNVGRVVRDHL